MSTPRIGLTQHIDASPRAVWDVISDLGSAAEVLSGVDSLELLTDGPYDVGTRWRETRTMFGMKDTMEMEVAESEPGRRTVVLSPVGDLLYRTELTLRPREGGGCELAMTFGAEQPPQTGLKALAATLLAGVGLRAAQRSMEQDLLDIAAAARHRG
ncbi:MAG: SRPBCC family protein [Brachybacterium sp.]|uniref:SRPBCC family protein n=1 Tax=Brachybacterium sp. TaxID=1891286 RepID=UPI0026562BB8|nr:SRPBCC family protein [Brachybacterium sp.]MDN6303267.1 SRPBCC family protein [Brachybacterium sp.]MDN6330285.1 SRPBCC family protein [Brachybacterium sp.]